MLTPALLLIVGASLAWSGLDFVRKRLADRIAALPLLVGLTVGPLPFFAWWAWSSGGGFGPGYWLPGLASVALNTIANLGYLRAVAVSPFSATIPLLSLTPVFTSLLAVPLLGEVPASLQWVGIGCTVLGALVLNLAAGERPTAALRAFRREPGSPIMAGVALLWSMTVPLDKLAMARSSPALHALVLTGGVAVATLAVLAGRRELGGLRSLGVAVGGLILALLFSAAGLSLQLLALRIANAGSVETIKRAIGGLLALVFGWLAFGEGLSWRRLGAVATMAVGVGLLLLPAGPAGAATALDRIALPPGFHIALYAEVPGARSMAWSSNGILYVGTRDVGKVYAVEDDPKTHRAARVRVVAQGLNMPNGVAWKDGSLWVAEVERVIRFDDLDHHLDRPPAPVVVNASFPRNPAHGWKYLRFGPDGKLYVPVGAPCNVCLPPGPVYAALHRMNPDGTGLERYASGIRNTVGFDWDPRTGELWFTDNGRDWLGDDAPPDELDHAPRPGLDFGFPYCHGGDLPDPKFGRERPCADFTPPAQKLGPHVASLGMRFYSGTMFPPEYRGRIFIAEHGSWNRSVPTGYRVTMVTLDGGRAVAYAPFATGWLREGRPWGRPVDVLVAPDGALLVSDDYAGAIYRISFESR